MGNRVPPTFEKLPPVAGAVDLSEVRRRRAVEEQQANEGPPNALTIDSHLVQTFRFDVVPVATVVPNGIALQGLDDAVSLSMTYAPLPNTVKQINAILLPEDRVALAAKLIEDIDAGMLARFFADTHAKASKAEADEEASTTADDEKEDDA